MLPVMIDRFKPAATLMQSIMTMRERLLGDDRKTALPEPAASGQAGSLQDDYFDNLPSVTQVMTHLFEKVIGYLNEGLAGGGEGWREEALLKPEQVPDTVRIPSPSDPDFSFRDAAQKIKAIFDMDFLARDPELSGLIGDTLGFQPGGMDVTDLIEAFADPDGATHERVEHILSEALAGHEGSAATERLKEALAMQEDAAGMVEKAYRDAMLPDRNDAAQRRFFVI